MFRAPEGGERGVTDDRRYTELKVMTRSCRSRGRTASEPVMECAAWFLPVRLVAAWHEVAPPPAQMSTLTSLRSNASFERLPDVDDS